MSCLKNRDEERNLGINACALNSFYCIMLCISYFVCIRVIEFSGPFSKQKLIIKPNLKNGDSGWGWSASKYSLEHIETAMHNFQLISDSQDDVHVHVDRHSMGLGGYDSWSPNVKDEFLVKGGRIVTGKLSLSVVI